MLQPIEGQLVTRHDVDLIKITDPVEREFAELMNDALERPEESSTIGDIIDEIKRMTDGQPDK